MDGQVSVTGVLVTGKDPGRYPLAKNAVAAWLWQSYSGPRELLILNDSEGSPLFAAGEVPPGVRQVAVRPTGQSLGALRNRGIEEAQTDYLVQWDDDDYSHRERLAWQVERTDPGSASVFLWEVHCHLRTGQAFANCGRGIRCGGFPGTMLWPRDTDVRFPELGRREDTEFLLRLRKQIPLQILENPSEYYIRFYHGMNTWSRKHVMNRKPGSRELRAGEREYLDRLLTGPYQEIRSRLCAAAD